MSKTFDVLAIGSCYIDTNLTNFPFSDTGIPAEVELLGDHYETVPGGSAVNFCSLLQTLGLNTAFMGMAGSDPNADILAELLEAKGIAPTLVRQSQARTAISFNMTNPSGKNIMLVAGNANAALHWQAIEQKAAELMPQVKMVHVGGCFKLKLMAPDFGRIAAMVHEAGAKLVIDHGKVPQGVAGDMLHAVKDFVLQADYYFPSRDEFCKLWQVNSIPEGLTLLHEQAVKLTVIVKDGANGAYYWDDGVQHVPAVAVQNVQNVTGAGDSFNAGVMTALAKGVKLTDAVPYGCRVAAAKITNQALPALTIP